MEVRNKMSWEYINRFPFEGDYPGTGDIFVPRIGLFVSRERPFYGTWGEVHKNLQEDGKRMLTISKFFVFSRLRGGKEWKDALTIRLPKNPLGALPYLGGEWLDARFEKVNGKMYIHSHHELTNGILVPRVSQRLEHCIMERAWINLNSLNRQGLPTKKLDSPSPYSENFRYDPPTDGEVMCFFREANGQVTFQSRSPSFPSWISPHMSHVETNIVGARAAYKMKGCKR